MIDLLLGAAALLLLMPVQGRYLMRSAPGACLKAKIAGFAWMRVSKINIIFHRVSGLSSLVYFFNMLIIFNIIK